MFKMYIILQILIYLSPTFDVLKFLHDSRASGHISIFGLVFFVLKSLLEMVRQRSPEKFAILSPKPRSHVIIFIYRTWAIWFVS